MMRLLVVSAMLLASPVVAHPQVRIEVGMPSFGIGVDFPTFPRMVVVPGYPVYYAPDVNANLFFYDGLYWVFAGDGWYESPWFNGPWTPVAPGAVPLFILRVPVGYYRAPAPWFRHGPPGAPPAWGERWGGAWERRRAGWDRWDRSAVPRPAPLPVYGYWPRESEVRAAYQSHGMHGKSASAERPGGEGKHGGGKHGGRGGD